MRVIAGEARGLPLRTPSARVRPTMDRVRGAIFSSLGDAVPGARVLDLFAGSGAMGIEALSRGAVSAIFVEADPRCAACIRENLRRARLEASVQVMDALKFLDLRTNDDFDLIFADPPYAKSSTSRNFAAELLRSSLALRRAESERHVSPGAPRRKPGTGANPAFAHPRPALWRE